VELLWTSNQTDAETSFYQHKTLTRRYPCLQRHSNLQSRQASGRWDQPEHRVFDVKFTYILTCHEDNRVRVQVQLGVNARPPPIYSRERPGTHCTGCWMGLGAGVYGRGQSSFHRHPITLPPSPCRAVTTTHSRRDFNNSYMFRLLIRTSQKLVQPHDYVHYTPAFGKSLCTLATVESS